MRSRWLPVLVALVVAVALWTRSHQAPEAEESQPSPPPPAAPQEPRQGPPESRPLVADYGDMQERMATARTNVERRLDYFHDQSWYREVGR